jgi:hypothetical protein
MPKLHEVQCAMTDALLAGAGVPACIAGDAQDALRRLDVYRSTIIGTLVRALRLGFPAVERLVGSEFFDGAAQVFALAHPPTSADLNAYGATFAAFLRDFPACAGLPYLADVARLDRAVARALHADDAAPLAPRELARIDPAQVGTLRLRFHPSVSLLHSAYPVDTIWAAVLARDEAAMTAIDLQRGPVHLLVERVDGKPAVVRMPAAAWTWTCALAQGRALGELPDLAKAGELGAVLAQHLLVGRVIALQTDPFEEVPR